MAEASTTSLELPPSLPYPIRINRILVSPSSVVKRGTPLFEYTFTSDSARKLLAKGGGRDESGQQAREWDMVGTYESRIDGTLERWEGWVKQGAIIERKNAGRPVIWLEQPCTHPVQLHGMCAICGMDLTSDDYMSRPAEEQSGPSKYPGSFEMSHDALGVTVSTKEAKRLESQTRDTLLGSKRLSLIVDLDQTIIHTTVDPTVGEWMAEMDEASGSAETGKSTANGETTTPPGSPSKNKGKEINPNARALRDVARFQLPDELPPGYNARIPDRNYYTKPRPGLQDFLERMNILYEMHVYTMGTRSYAEAICNVVDPEGKFFGGRIISRDENRNFNSKNLKRLFPTDQSMVVVIDDRADVWGDIPNLVKVVPYDFFIGIGDINSGFLPPVPTSPASTASPIPVTPPDEAMDLADTANAIAQTKMLDAVSEERPLAKLQEDLESESSASDRSDPGATADEKHSSKSPETNGSDVPMSSNGSLATARRPLLNDDDDELQRVGKILGEIHGSFYRAYSRRTDKALDAPLPLGCDVEVIVPDIKSRVLEGCTIVFSGVIPKHQRPEQSEIFAAAEAFGARPILDVTSNMTHCVTAALSTEKTHRAIKIGAFVVWVDWFHKSVALWEKQDEREFLVIPDAGPSRSSSRPDTPQILVDGESNGLETNGLVQDVPMGDMDMSGWDGNDDLMGGKEWDEKDDADLQAFMADGSDYGDDGTEAGDTDSRTGDDPPVPSPPVTAPGSPGKKRVRYADEESLPLESFRDPPEPAADGTDSPPKKRLLLMAPSEDEHVPPEHRYQWRGKMKREQEDRERAEKEAAAQAGKNDSEEDLFAQMLEDSMGN